MTDLLYKQSHFLNSRSGISLISVVSFFKSAVTLLELEGVEQGRKRGKGSETDTSPPCFEVLPGVCISLQFG